MSCSNLQRSSVVGDKLLGVRIVTHFEYDTVVSNEMQRAILEYVDAWLVHNGIGASYRAEALNIDNRTFNRWRSGERTLRTDQIVDLAHRLKASPAYMALVGSLPITPYQRRLAIKNAAANQASLEQMFQLPPHELEVFTRNLSALYEASRADRGRRHSREAM